MNPDMFLSELTTIFDKNLKPAQVTVYKDKLRRFAPEQLIEILNRVIEEAKGFPRVSDIFKAAQDCGFLAVDTCTTRVHHWQESKCGLCHGEGRLAIFWEFWYEERDTGRVEIQRLAKVVQYSQSLDLYFENQFRAIFRCRCEAGALPTIPKAYPRLLKQMPTQREVWA